MKCVHGIYYFRGSPHVHGILWLDGAPDVSDISKKTPEERQKIIDYFDELICTNHPNLNAPRAPIHPSRIELENVIDLDRDLAELLNNVQKHTKHTAGYCYKMNHKTKKMECRFGFPKPTPVHKSDITISENGDVEFVSSRNDALLNKYNHYMIQAWRANMDIAPVLSKRALVNYLAKYVSKSENKSINLVGLVNDLCQNSPKGVKNIIHKLFIRACSDRDYSAQEVGHIVMGEKLVSAGGRDFVYVFLQTNDDWIHVENEQSNVRNGQSVLQKYLNRAVSRENQSLWHMAQCYNFNTKKPRLRKAIVMVCPKISYKQEKDNNEKYFRMQTLLHVPWRKLTDFDTEQFTWKQIYDHNINIIKQNEPNVTLDDVQAHVEDLAENDEDNHNYLISRADWEDLSAMGPSQSTRNIILGRRYTDANFDWSASYSKYEKYGSIPELQEFVSNAKAKADLTVNDITPYPNVELNTEQRKIVSLVEKQLQLCRLQDIENSGNIPKTVVVQGSAGKSYSYYIHSIVFSFHNYINM